jgi:hypothetical protein
MDVTKISIIAEIDGEWCSIPSEQFENLGLTLHILSSVSKYNELRAVKIPKEYKVQEFEFKRQSLTNNVPTTSVDTSKR